MWKDGTCMDQHLSFSCELYVSYGSKPSGTRMVPEVIASYSPKHSMAMQQEPIYWRYLPTSTAYFLGNIPTIHMA